MNLSRSASLGICLLAAAGAGCATTGARITPVPPGSVAGRPPDTAPALPAPGDAIAATGLQYQGVAYRSGGASPAGFDCSGLVTYVFGRHGQAVPRIVRDQFDAGRPVERSAIRPGDLVFFRTAGRAVSHVGIAVGEGRFVHAPNGRGVVRVESFLSGYWAERFAGARRVE